MSRSMMSVLNNLYAGKQIVIAFKTYEEQETFRVAIYKLKKTQDEAMVAVLDEEKVTLRHSAKFDEENGITSTYWTEKKKQLEFTVLSIEDKEPAKDSNVGGKRQASLPVSMGSDTSISTKDSTKGRKNSTKE